jgi:hypothetical protein
MSGPNDETSPRKPALLRWLARFLPESFPVPIEELSPEELAKMAQMALRKDGFVQMCDEVGRPMGKKDPAQR